MKKKINGYFKGLNGQPGSRKWVTRIQRKVNDDK